MKSLNLSFWNRLVKEVHASNKGTFAGWFMGVRIGLAFCLLAFLVNMLLIMFGGRIGLNPFLEGAIAGVVALIFMGGAVLYMADLREKLDQEFTNRRRIETALRISENFNSSVLQALAANIAVLNRTGQIVEVNEAWRKFARENGAREGWSGIGSNYLEICRRASGEGAEIAAKTALGIQAVLEGAESLFTMEYPCHAPNQKRWFSLYVTPLSHEQGGAVVAHVNITERVQSEQRLEYLATHDALTGLYNRAFFERELQRIQEKKVTPISVVMADVDGLKQTNDQQGHAAGDELLRRAADMLKSVFRDSDALARIGGDEFAVLLPGVDEKLCAIIRQRVAQRMEHSRKEDTPAVRMSLGSATARESSGLLEALKMADEAMYEEKMRRKGQQA